MHSCRVNPFSVKSTPLGSSPPYAFSRSPLLRSRTTVAAKPPWETLGVDASASTAEVKRAYRRLVLRHHPDVVGTATSDTFLELQEAYSLMIGKLSGKGSKGEGGWDFHDWFWNFAKNHRRKSADGAGPMERPVGRSHLNQQLENLKARAWKRERKANNSHEAAVPEEVHPAWASAQRSHEIDTVTAAAAAGNGPQHCRQSGVEEESPTHVESEAKGTGADSDSKHETSFQNNVYAHRPPGVGSSHLTGQLSGLQRRAMMRQRQA